MATASSVGLAVVLAATGCASSAGSSAGKAGSSIELASIGDYTGVDSVNAPGFTGGEQAAIKAINDAGGIKGHLLVLKQFDAQSDVTDAESAARQALASNPAAVVGGVAGAEPSAIAPISQAAPDIPWVTVQAPNSATSGISYWFTLGVTPAQVAAEEVSAVKTELGGSLSGKKIAFGGSSSPNVDNDLSGITSLVTAAGGTMSSVIRNPNGLTSWSSEAADIVAKKPAAVILIFNEADTAVAAKALGVAGFSGPVVACDSASSDALLQTVDQPNFVSIRETASAVPGTALYRVGQAAGVSATAMSNSYFGKGYGEVYVVKAVLDKCGLPCPSSKFVPTLKALGDITIPDDVFLGPLNFSRGQSGLTTAQLVTWNATKDESELKGSPFSILGS